MKWKLGLTITHRSQIPSHLRSIRAILAVESSIHAISAVEIMEWKLGLTITHGSQVPSHFRSNLCNLSRWEHGMEVGTYHYTWVPSPKSLEVNLCNLSRWEHGMEVGTYHFTWGPKSQVWHGCLHGIYFLEVRLGTCIESWVKQKANLEGWARLLDITTSVSSPLDPPIMEIVVLDQGQG